MLIPPFTKGFKPVAASPKKPDFSAYSLPELREMATELTQVIGEKEKSEKVALAADIETLAKERGFSLTDILPLFPNLAPSIAPEPQKKPAAKADRSGGTVPPKYRNPANSAETWSGRGRKPAWMQAHLDAGGTPDQLAIAAA